MKDTGVQCLSLKGHGNWERVSEDWERANVAPVLKQGKMEDPGNYRLVSLTSTPGR